uniref:Uncharacterized protein n=1 Tax=Oryza sativa subsp. japonica TaxID=39947 RepID=Q7XB89_ORYSJ|nr:hypothetical protein [Oryza sativa Japonica Group]BAD31866.1 hypothetical protein [Oryza sativa Japonica Group]
MMKGRKNMRKGKKEMDRVTKRKRNNPKKSGHLSLQVPRSHRNLPKVARIEREHRWTGTHLPLVAGGVGTSGLLCT